MHMTIGSAIDKKPEDKNENGAMRAKKMNVAQSEYIINMIKNGQSNY